MYLDQTEVKYSFSNILDLTYSLVINCVNKIKTMKQNYRIP